MTPARAALFVSHGAPDLLLEPGATRDFLAGLGATLRTTPFVVVVSAHWWSESPEVDLSGTPRTIHDFAGFGPELAAWRYPASGAPAAAERAAQLIERAGLPVERRVRGLDHGAWVPLSLMAPAADVPAFQLSIQPQRDARHHFALGRAIAPLLDGGALLLASGGATHDLSRLGQPVDEGADRFERWLVERVEAGDRDALLDWERAAPSPRSAHPSPDHLLPLFVALGAAPEGPGTPLHRGLSHGSLHMTAFGWGTR